jgi:exonuclease SbcC
MKLYLKNFRCYKDKEIEFEDDLFTLLKGASGTGKSTLFNAIFYVLYGELRNICSYNEKKTTVELKVKNMKIVRSNSPKKLTVEITENEKKVIYENEPAQKIINEIYGKNFNITSYITQKNAVHFFSLSGAEKMNFLQTILTGMNEEIENVKEKCKVLISSSKKDLTCATAEYELLLQQLAKMDKLQMIECPIDIDENESLENALKKHQQKWNKIRETIQNNEKLLNELNEKVKLSLKNKVMKENYENKLIELNERKKNLEENLNNFVYQKSSKELQTEITILKSKLKTEKEAEKIQLQKEKEHELLTKKFNELKIVEEELPFLDDLTSKEKNLKTKIKNLQTLQKNKFLKESLQKEKTRSTKTIEELTNKLNEIEIDYNIEELQNGIVLCKDYTKKKEELSKINLITNETELQTEYENIENMLNILITTETLLQESKKIRKCPKCACSFRIENENVVLTDLPQITKTEDEINKERKKLINRKNEITKILKTNTESLLLKKELTDKLKYISENENFFEDWSLQELENELASCKKLTEEKNEITRKLKEEKKETKIKEIQKELDILTTDLNTEEITETEEELTNNLSITLSQISKNKEITKEINSLKTLLQKLNYVAKNYVKIIEEFELNITDLENKLNDALKVENINKELTEVKKEEDKTVKLLSDLIIYDDLTEEIQNLEKKLNNNKEKNEKYFELQPLIEKYVLYLEKGKEIKEKERQVEEAKIKEENKKNELAFIEKFYNKVLEAESSILLSKLDELNESINYYLEKFFPTEPITVNITPFKETKKDIKHIINTEIGYKGVNTDLTNLSGGEYDRVILATVLAFNNVFGNDLLLLDESISSLNEELTEDILEVLYESLKGKTVILIAHQISEGVFDKVINL